MGSYSNAPVPDVFLTAFGSFHDVNDNPSAKVLQGLKSEYETDPSFSASFSLHEAHVLDVKAKEASAWVEDVIYGQIEGASRQEEGADLPPPEAVVIHIGVDGLRSRMQLETYGANEARFRVADEAGWKPAGERIDAGGTGDGGGNRGASSPPSPRAGAPAGGLELEAWTGERDPSVPASARTNLGELRKSTLPLERIFKRLRERGVPIDRSSSAGRFVCNFVYYVSLGLAARSSARTGRSVHALFVHVPSEGRMPVDEQIQAAKAVVEEVVRAVGGGDLAGLPSRAVGLPRA